MSRSIFLHRFRNQDPKKLTLREFLEKSDIESGWYGLVTDLCLKLWCLGWDGGMIQCKEKFGVLRFHPIQTSVITDQMWTVIRESEIKSCSICEQCGAESAALRTDRYWIKTLCDECDLISRIKTPDQYHGD